MVKLLLEIFLFIVQLISDATKNIFARAYHLICNRRILSNAQENEIPKSIVRLENFSFRQEAAGPVRNTAVYAGEDRLSAVSSLVTEHEYLERTKVEADAMRGAIRARLNYVPNTRCDSNGQVNPFFEYFKRIGDEVASTRADPAELERPCPVETPSPIDQTTRILVADPREWENIELYESQLEIVEEIFRGYIYGVALMLDGERRSYDAARKAISKLRLKSWQVHAQVSMGEFIETKYEKAEGTFNSKRVDVLVCDNNSMPRRVIEHQGGGHIRFFRDLSGKLQESRSDILRNEVKKKVIARSGIPFLETWDDESPEEVASKIEECLSKIATEGSDLRRKSITMQCD